MFQKIYIIEVQRGTENSIISASVYSHKWRSADSLVAYLELSGGFSLALKDVSYPHH